MTRLKLVCLSLEIKKYQKSKYLNFRPDEFEYVEPNWLIVKISCISETIDDHLNWLVQPLPRFETKVKLFKFVCFSDLQ